MALRVVELFAGIGAQRMALMLGGIPHESVAIAEIDKFALASYEAIYGPTPNLGDVSQVESLPECDLLTYSFPCQDLSMAGKRAGMGEGTGTRSALVWEVVRLLESSEHRPEWLLMENVPAVLSAPEWPSLVSRLEALGYRSRWGKLDSSRFGSAQKRVRAFMVSRLGADPPELPTCSPNAPSLCLRDVMEPERSEKYVHLIPMDRIKWRDPGQKCSLSVVGEDMSEGQWKPHRYIMDPGGPSRCVGAYVNDAQRSIKVVADWDRAGRLDLANRIYSPDGASPTMVGMGGGNRDIKVIAEDTGISSPVRNKLYSPDGTSPTVLHQGRHGVSAQITVVADDTGEPYERMGRIYSPDGKMPTLDQLGRRGNQMFKIAADPGETDPSELGGCLTVNKLMPRECWRLMGFPEWAYMRARRVVSETQLYNQAGNSIVVEVLVAIFRALFTPSMASAPRQTTFEDCWGRAL